MFNFGEAWQARIDNIHASYEMRIGLFETNFGFIKNLNMTGVYIYLPSDHSAIMTDVGTVCGVNAAGGYIVNVRVSGTIKTHRLYSYTGGIVGRNRGWIQDVQFGNVGGAWGILEVNGDVGGIAGGNDVGALIKNATADCVRILHYMIYQARAMGGIVGTSYYGQLENVTVSWTYIENFGQYSAANASPYVGIIVGNFINSSLLGAVAGNVFLVQGTLTSNQLNNFGQTPWWSWGGRAQGRCIIDGVVHNF